VTKDPYRYFRVEARELLEGLGRGALALEQGADPELVPRLLRLAHTLKGAARIVKQQGIAELAHAAEDVLAPFRDTKGPVARPRVDELLRLVDRMGAQVAALSAPAPAAGTEGSSESRTSNAESQLFDTLRVEVEEVDAVLGGIGEAGVHVAGLLKLVERMRAQVAVLRGPPQGAGTAGSSESRTPKAESRLSDLERTQRAVSGGLDDLGRDLALAAERADRLRLPRAATIFPALERAARDAAATLGRAMTFRATGGDIRLDAHVLAGLRDALLHLVRNAVAHGVEPAADRQAHGKPAAGLVELCVERRGTQVAFLCRDDGAGVDAAAVYRAAARRGIAAEGEPDLSRAVDLLLQGGISTAETLTVVSGRGIGLGAAREAARRLRGTLVIRTEPGRGTAVEICVPVSLASVQVLHVEAGGATTCVPLESIVRVLRLEPGELAAGAQGDRVAFEGAALPFVPLSRLLRGPPPAPAARRTALVMTAGAERAVVGVDRLGGGATVLLRPVPASAEADATVAGVCLDAEGSPRLVLDPAGVVAAARADTGAPAAPAASRAPVLVVDDSLTTRMLEQSILESAGYEVDVACSGEEGLEKARARRYGLFLVDVEMPGMDGYQFVRAAKADPGLGAVPAILVTSRSSQEDRRRGAEAGARGFMAKGEFDQALLLRTIRELAG